VEESLQIIRKNNGRNAQLISLGKELEELKIEDLDVDEAVTVTHAREEVMLLKKSIEGGGITAADLGGGGGVSSEELAAATADNAKLRKLLEEAQKAIQDAKESGAASAAAAAAAATATAAPAAAADASGPDPETEAKLAALETEAAVLRQAGAERDTTIGELKMQLATTQGELTAANAAVLAAETAGAAGAAGAGAAAEAKIAALQTEMAEKLAAAAKEVE
jgi:hypothetical protein